MRGLRIEWRVVLVLAGLAWVSILPAWAQESEALRLSVRRVWGYGGGDQIQGLFSLEALGPANLASVVFKLDETVIGEVTAPPFKMQINTDNYPHGWHDLVAVGTTADGRTLTSAARRYEFVSAEAGWEVARTIMVRVGLGVGLLLAVVLGIQLVPALLGKKRQPIPLGAPRRYGLKGGAICPKCQRPFGIHWFSFNLITRIFDYCEHCGQWSAVDRATPEQLRAAEAAEVQLAQPETPVVEEAPEAKLKRQLDDSRYLDDV